MLRSLSVLVTRSLPGRFISGRSFPVLSVRAPSRLMSTENPENLMTPTPLSKLIDQLVPIASLIAIVVAVAGAASYVNGVLTKLEERIAGVIKEVDAKNAGTKETIEKEVDAKIAGFKEAADLKYSLKSNK